MTGNVAIAIVVLPAPVISGTASVCAGATGSTYSVTATAGNSYVWAINGGTITSGGGTNSISVTWGTGSTGTVDVTETSGICSTAATQFAVTINTLPVPTITGTTSVCASSSGNIYSTETGMTGYSWSISSGGTITAGSGTNAITVTWNTAGAQTVSVNYNNTNGCAAVSATVYNITVNPLPAVAGTITGIASVCQGQTAVAYTVPAITNATSYVWVYSGTGATITGTTNAVTITFAATATSGNLTVYGSNTCGNGAISANYAVTVNPLPSAAGTITGTATVCQGQTAVAYTVPVIANATSYVWAYSGTGATITGTTNAVTIAFAAAATAGNLTVYGTNTCGDGATSANYAIGVNPLPAAAGTITGTATVCQGQTAVSYAVPAITNATSYVWTYSGTGATITGTTNTVTITFAATATSGNLTVSGSNTCGNGIVSANYAVTVNPLPAVAGTITGTASVCQGQTTIAYTVPAITNATSYVWAYSGTGATITGTTNAVTITFAAAATSGNLTVYGSNTCGNGAISANYAVTVNPLPLVTFTAQPGASAFTTRDVTYTTQAGMTNYIWVFPGTSGVDYTIISGGTTTSNTVTLQYLTAGSKIVTVNYSNANGCTAAAPTSSTATTVSVLPTITITATDVHKTYGSALTGPVSSTSFTITGTLQAGDNITAVIINYGTGATAASVVGTYTGSVTPSAASGTFNAANYNVVYVSGNLIVDPAQLTITANNVTKNFGTTITGGAGSTAFTSIGLQNGQTIGSVTIAYGTGAAAAAAVGTYTGSVTASAATGGTFTAGNYTIVYVAGNIIVNPAGTLTITATNVTKTYGTAITGSAGSTAFTAVGLLNGETIGSVTITYGTGAAATAAVGTYTGSVTPSAASGGTFNPANYTSIVYALGNIIVNPAQLTITANTVTKNFGTTITGGPGSTAFTAAGLQNGQTIGSVTVAYGTGSAASAVVGIYAGSVAASAPTGGTFTASNYTISYVSGNIVVNAAGTLTITATDATKTYGTLLAGGAGSAAFTAEGLLNGETVGSVTIAYGSGASATDAVGTYTGSITPSAAIGGTFNPGNYTSIVYVVGNLIVNPAQLTVTANNVFKNFGTSITGSTGSTAFTSTGLQNGEAIGSVTIGYGVGAAATAAVGTYTGSVTASAATGGTFMAGNYTINYAAGNVIVNPSGTLTITATDVTKTYGSALSGGAGSTAFTAIGLLNGETIGTVTINFGSGAAATAAVGSYSGSVIPSAPSGGTFNPANYSIVFVSGNLVVNPAPLNITATDVHKPLGDVLTGGTGSTAFTSVGLQNGQTIGSVTIAYGIGSAATDPVGTYPSSVMPSAVTGGSFITSNYTITYTNGDIIVDPAGTLTIIAKNKNKTYGDVLTGSEGSTDFTVSGLVNGETISSVTVAYGTGAAGAAVVGTYTGSVTVSYPVGTFNSANYTAINFVPGNIIVGMAPLTVTANSRSHVYGTTLTGDGAGSTAYTSAGLQNGETIVWVTTAYGAGKLATAAVGTYSGSVAISAAVGTFNPANYAVTYNNGDITVIPAQLTITANDVVKNFGSTLTNGLTSTAFNSVGLQNGETIGSASIVYGNGAQAYSPSGTYSGQVGISAATGGTFIAGNYQIAYVAGTIFVGLPPWLTVTADAQSKCADGAPFAANGYTVTYSGFTDGDTPAVLGGTVSYSGNAIGATNAGSYIIIPGGLSSAKYSFIYVNGTLTINPGPVVIINNPALVCSTTTVDLTAAAVTAGSSSGLMFTYWMDAGATIAMETPSEAAAPGTYYIKGTATGGCSTTKPVIITANPAPTLIISNPAAVCTPATVNITSGEVTAGSTPGLVYTYWTDPDATVRYNTPSAATNGTYYIKGTTSLGCSDIKPVKVKINPIPDPTIDGDANPCIGSTQIYKTESERSGYEWIVSGGGQIIAGGTATDSTVTVTWNGGGNQTVSVNYSNGSNCKGTTARVKNVIVTNNPAAAGPITGERSVCAGSQNVVYTVPPVANATSYAWSIPSTVATIVQGDGTPGITVNFASDAESGNISVSGVGCTNGTPSNLAISVTQRPGDAGSITGEHTFSIGTSGAVYTVDPIANATSYNWSLPPGATIASGANTDSISVDFGESAVAGNLSVYGSNVSSCPNGAASPDFALTIPEKSFGIYPVPSNGVFTASITFPVESTFTLRIYDHLGNKIMEIVDARTVGGSWEKIIDLGSVSNGLYFVEFYNASFQEVLKLIINR